MGHHTSNGHPNDDQRRRTPGERVFDPESVYDTPGDVVRDPNLRRREKLRALESWDDVARMRLAATDEGMPAHGTTSSDLKTLEDIEAARRAVDPRTAETHPSRDVVTTKEARQGSSNLTNYRVLFNSLVLAAIAALIVGLLWWNWSP